MDAISISSTLRLPIVQATQSTGSPSSRDERQTARSSISSTPAASPAQTAIVVQGLLTSDVVTDLGVKQVEQVERTLKPYGISMLPNGPSSYKTAGTAPADKQPAIAAKASGPQAGIVHDGADTSLSTDNFTPQALEDVAR